MRVIFIEELLAREESKGQVEEKGQSEEKKCKKCKNMYDVADHLANTEYLDRYCCECYRKLSNAYFCS